METLEIITTAINVVTMLLAVITFVVSACQYRRQQKLSFFEKYTARYQYLMEHMPEEFFSAYDKMLEEGKKKEISHYIRLYLDLCSEEYMLYKDGRIDKTVWKEWKEGIVYSFKNPYLSQYWIERIKEYEESYSTFFAFVKDEILKQTNK